MRLRLSRSMKYPFVITTNIDENKAKFAIWLLHPHQDCQYIAHIGDQCLVPNGAFTKDELLQDLAYEAVQQFLQ